MSSIPYLASMDPLFHRLLRWVAYSLGIASPKNSLGMRARFGWPEAPMVLIGSHVQYLLTHPLAASGRYQSML